MQDMATISDLKTSMRGAVIDSADPGYDQARALYNGMIDKRPRAIARCADVADVIAAVNFARTAGLPLAIRGGGHNGPGLGSVNDGLVIDLSDMKGIRVDPAARTARVGAGCTQGDVDHATHAFGLAVPAGIISTTGIAGLTLSGGHGYLSRKYGLTIDNLIEADVVLADGSFVTASKEKNADLLWALRGGGGNFGVVTSFLFRLHPVSMVFAGPVAFDQKHARTIMQRYREFLPKAPEDLGIFLGLKKILSSAPFPQEYWGKRICLLMCCFNGSEEDGKKALAPLLDSLPEPWFNWMGVMPYPAVQSMFDGLYPKGMQWYWRGDFVKTLSDDAIDAHLAQAANTPSELSLMHLYPIDGAIHRVGKGETAWSCRDATWSMVIAGIDPDAKKAGDVTQWTKAYWEAVHPYDLGGAYPNFMMDDEGDARIKETFGENYGRLQAVKKKYDPTNLFRVNQNIRPAN
ncbi:FAD-binding oxidoreductase [Hyphomicrobium sp. CS1BSMeth3]|uniref:FAD-binding oxidoreductase n=1 Tax=Hyphomicrobium sp. CS1BSMeth3 TaxID=1892844 RepID=UPI000931D9D1|nr:FAD-binding oxidoreductase [Hyphomicrobium sp. CS1BSMeth3]